MHTIRSSNEDPHPNSKASNPSGTPDISAIFRCWEEEDRVKSLQAASQAPFARTGYQSHETVPSNLSSSKDQTTNDVESNIMPHIDEESHSSLWECSSALSLTRYYSRLEG